MPAMTVVSLVIGDDIRHKSWFLETSGGKAGKKKSHLKLFTHGDWSTTMGRDSHGKR